MSEAATVGALIAHYATVLDAAQVGYGHGTTNAQDEAAWLVLWQLGLPLDAPLDGEDSVSNQPVAEEIRRQLATLFEARIQTRKPAAYLTREAWLQGVPFYVDERVIVPRSFIAELLHEQLTPWVEDPWAIGSALDLCTGSGCLAILTALAFPESQVDAVDLSKDAISVAKRNVEEYDLSERIEIIQSDAFTNLAGKRYDLIISNPPYVNADSVVALPPEYLHEPVMALGSGKDGLDFTRIILREAKRHLNPDGLLVVEIGHNRTELEAAYPALPFTWLDTAAGDEFVFLLHAADLPD